MISKLQSTLDGIHKVLQHMDGSHIVTELLVDHMGLLIELCTFSNLGNVPGILVVQPIDGFHHSCPIGLARQEHTRIAVRSAPYWSSSQLACSSHLPAPLVGVPPAPGFPFTAQPLNGAADLGAARDTWHLASSHMPWTQHRARRCHFSWSVYPMVSGIPFTAQILNRAADLGSARIRGTASRRTCPGLSTGHAIATSPGRCTPWSPAFPSPRNS